MNILFIFLRHSEDQRDSTLTKDLSDEFHKNGHKITVVTLLEEKYNKETRLKNENGYDVLRIKTGNYFNVPNKLEKAITVLTMARDLRKGILRYLRDKKYDLIVTHTPFVSTEKLILPLKRHFKCPAHLILWDIFPQNAWDIKIIKNRVLFKFFKMREKKMLKVYDYISCMSEGNIKYMNENYPYLKKENIKLIRNWAVVKEKIIIDKKEIRNKYGFHVDDFILIFGGNMGKPQRLENIFCLAEKLLEKKNIKFLFIGSGSEERRLKNIVIEKKLENVCFIEKIPREEYEKIIAACDVGMVSLDERFTVPNFPSKTTDYFKLALPIIASLDKCSMEDYGKWLLKEVKAGICARAGNVQELYEKVMYLYNNRELMIEFGNNGRKYYEENLDVNRAYQIIIDEIKTNKE